MKSSLRKYYKGVGLTATIMASSILVHSAQGQSAEALMDALVRKGILTEQEAEDIKTDMARESASINKVKAPNATTSKFELYGDFRGRFEGFYTSHEDFITQNRWRYRARLGVRASLTENFEAGFRIGSGDLDGGVPTGGVDPISQNQSFQNNGSKKGVFIDLAYARWRTDPRHVDYTGNFTFGKMENPFEFSSLLFDRDYTPEGLASQWTYSLNLEHTLAFNAGGFVVDELAASSNDPYLLGAQLRYNSIWKYNAEHKPKLQTSFGVAALMVTDEENLPNAAVPNRNVGNTRDGATGQLTSNFNPIVADAAIIYTLDSFPLYNGTFPIKLSGDYLYNPGASTKNQGFAAGITFGKAGKKATWDIGYEYRFQESDSWFEEFIESDFGAFYSTPWPNSGQAAGYRSGTNAKGNIVRVNYSPYNALTFSISWFNARVIDPPPGSDGPSLMNRVMVDATVKF